MRAARFVLCGAALAAALADAAACNPPSSGGSSPTSARRDEGNAEALAITWPAPHALDVASRASLPAAAQASVARAPLPVLVPSDRALLSRAQVVADESYYAVSIPTGDGATVSVHATRVAHRYASVPPIAGDVAIRGTRGFVTVNEGIRSASWIENGGAYAVEVECSAPSDARCASDAFVLSLVEHLAYVGGAGQ